jgi:hypothetical protein
MRENLKPGVDFDQSGSDAIPRPIYATRVQRESIKVRLQIGEGVTASFARALADPEGITNGARMKSKRRSKRPGRREHCDAVSSDSINIRD